MILLQRAVINQLYTTDDQVEFQSLFNELGFEIGQEEICEWLQSDFSDSGVQIYSDADICEIVNADMEEADEEEQSKCPVSNVDAAFYFQQCIHWQPEASTTVLRQLQSLAANERMDSLQQCTIDNNQFKKD